MRERARERYGFSVVSLLVLLLVPAIAAVIGFHLYLRPVVDGGPVTCRTNMQTIANAEQEYKVRSLAHEYVVIKGRSGVGGGPPTYTYKGAKTGKPVTDFLGVTADLQAMPICPKGSGYVYRVRVAPSTGRAMTYVDWNGDTKEVPAGGVLISCSYPDRTNHGYYCPGVDAQ